jgi:hypothetical protein
MEGEAMKKRILPEWATYRRAVLHRDSPPEQVNDLKNAFYGGAVSIFNLITTISERYPENKATRALEDINREFAEHVKEARKAIKKAIGRPKPAMKSITQHGPAPVLAGTLEIEEYGLHQWCPGAPDTKPEQLHLTIKIRGIEDMTLSLRFKTRKAWDDLTAIGDGHADEIWPDGDK